MNGRLGIIGVVVALPLLGVLAVVGILGLRSASDEVPEPGTSDASPAPEPDLLDVARDMIERMYAERDARAVLDAAEPGTLPRESSAQLRLIQELVALFEQRPFEVTEEELHTIRGVDVARIRVDVVNWCVTEDHRILLGCRVALASVDATTDLGEVELASVEIDILATRVDVAAVLVSATGEEVVLAGHPELDSEFARVARLVEVDWVMDGRRTRAPPGDLRLRPEVGLMFLFEMSETLDVARLDGATFRYVWPDGEVRIDVADIVWLVDATASLPDRQDARRTEVGPAAAAG